MRSFTRTAAILALMLLGMGSSLDAQDSIGIRIGPPPAPRVVRVQPATPGPSFVWVAGYWYPIGILYQWHDGYWTRPPYEGARWVGPWHDGESFYVGYWDGKRGRLELDHDSEREKERDLSLRERE
jgi:hypothetical protein